MNVSRRKHQSYSGSKRNQRYYKRRKRMSLARSIAMVVVLVAVVLVGSTFAMARFGGEEIQGGVTEEVQITEEERAENETSGQTSEDQSAVESNQGTEVNKEDTQENQNTQQNQNENNSQSTQENTNTQDDTTNGDTSKDDDTSEDGVTSKDEDTSRDEDTKTQWVGVGPAGEKYAYDATVISEKLRKYSYSNQGEKLVFLTFDDGTSTTVTPQILKILDEYQVKATFFLTGRNIINGGEAAKKLVLEEFERGHAIANHSYSHDYKILYPNRVLNLQNFIADFKKTDEILKEILGEGFSTRVLRCPGGFGSWKNMSQLSSYMEENNLVSIDWNSLSKDAEGAKKSAKELIENVKETAEGKEIVVILMHDTYGKEETAKALPKIIEYFQKNGYEFKTLV